MLPDPTVDQFGSVGGVARSFGGTESGILQIAQAQLGVPVPLCYGYVRARGNVGPTVQLADKTTVSFIFLGEGEWDGIERFWLNRKLLDPGDTTRIHFHPGTDGELGHGLPVESNGGDQRVDNFWSSFPAAVPRVTYSRTAYIALYVPPDPSAPSAAVDWLGDYRTTRCRVFDNAGAQTGYTFTTNPAWQIADVILRYAIKRGALINAALTAAEKARFDFVAFKDSADYYDALLAGGQKRFEGSFAFPQRATLKDRLDQMLMCCRSYIQEAGGVIALRADKPRAATFILTKDHVAAASFKPGKPQLRAAKNRLVGMYNDLNVAAIATVDTIANSGARRTSSVATLKFTAVHGFQAGDQIVAQNISDATFNVTATISDVPDNLHISFPNSGANVGAATAGGGTVGTPESKFAQRAPQQDHEQHQKAIGQVGAGLTAIAKPNPEQLDFGNNTGERAKRIMRHLLDRTLGPDAAPYQAPWSGQVEAWTESVDAGGNALCAQLGGDIVTVDKSVSDEYAGDYEIIETTPEYSSASSDDGQPGGRTLLNLKQYMPAAFPDVADDEAPIVPNPAPRDAFVRLLENQQQKGVVIGRAFGKNMLDNPGAEFNSVRTPLNTPLANGDPVGDGWIFAQNDAGFWQGRLGNTNPRSGAQHLSIYLPAGKIIPSDNIDYVSHIWTSAKLPVAILDIVRASGWVNFGYQFTPPAGVIVAQRIEALLFNSADAFIGDLLIERQVNTTGYLFLTVSLQIPATISGSVPAYIRFACTGRVRNNSGVNFNTGGADPYASMDFDDLVLNLQATAFDLTPINTSGKMIGATALSQSGATTTILVAARTFQFGDGQVSYNSGSVTPVAGYGTYFIYADDPTYSGGAVTYVATTTETDLYAVNGRVYFGKITTSGGGVVGTPSTGGTGSGKSNPV